MLEGSCNCQNVRFRVDGGGDSVAACHCGQCRKQSGHYWASGYAPDAAYDITGEVRWFEASPTAKRGFCPNCGCFLFWKAHAEDGMSFSLGAIDGPTGLRLHKHIFTRWKGDYYDIADDVPQQED
ncbi:GFA family protein [Aliishimia ponticola]|nr:GFA family protein [Aliishimia ponticola]